MQKLAYLAGPEVFLPNAAEIGQEKIDICKKYNICGLFPIFELDLNHFATAAPDRKEVALRIFRHNLQLMNRADFIIANMTPFRGPSIDPGTAFEIGYMHALHAENADKRIFLYSNVDRTYLERFDDDTGNAVDDLGMEIEDFGLRDNLMIHCAALVSRTEVKVHDAAEDQRFTDLTAFRACVIEAAALWQTVPQGPALHRQAAGRG
ncbi:MAG: hypothetical protein GVY13_12335 [Alphaproteobacteria bacterium]|nr:hypothetical protein [Alphaproteobacteria bacterium]